mmetsp:Transcript_2651/g.6930  ORF Transcript_2651/g.6930 Transcript_2651/m.6930 type:complete len:320 (-) Transcript_2651:318-1277(-)
MKYGWRAHGSWPAPPAPPVEVAKPSLGILRRSFTGDSSRREVEMLRRHWRGDSRRAAPRDGCELPPLSLGVAGWSPPGGCCCASLGSGITALRFSSAGKPGAERLPPSFLGSGGGGGGRRSSSTVAASSSTTLSAKEGSQASMTRSARSSMERASRQPAGKNASAALAAVHASAPPAAAGASEPSGCGRGDPVPVSWASWLLSPFTSACSVFALVHLAIRSFSSGLSSPTGWVSLSTMPSNSSFRISGLEGPRGGRTMPCRLAATVAGTVSRFLTKSSQWRRRICQPLPPGAAASWPTTSPRNCRNAAAARAVPLCSAL